MGNTFLKSKNKITKVVFFGTILCMAFIVGTRAFSVGHDTANYANIFSNVIQLDFNQLFTTTVFEDIEKGYMVLQWLFGKISPNPVHFFMAIAFFEYITIGIWVWKNSKKPFLSLIIFFCMFFTFFLTGIRQSIAITILLLSYDDIKKNKVVPFLLKVLIATLFHTTAIVFLPAFFINMMKKTLKYFVATVFLFPVIYIARNTIFVSVVSQFEKYNDYEILIHGDAITFTLLLFAVAIVAQFLLRVGKKFSTEEEHEYVFFCNMISVSLLIMPFVGLNGAILRVAMYYFIYICLLVIKIYHRFPERAVRIPVEVLSITLLIVLFLNNVFSTTTYQYEFVGWRNIFSLYGGLL